jgi:hypothetical protein
MATEQQVSPNIKFYYTGPFDRVRLHQACKEQRLPSKKLQGLDTLIGFIERDRRIKDIRWAAYVLATAYWETHDMEPCEEDKSLREKHRYNRTVKVKALGGGTARVTTQVPIKGDYQFLVHTGGTYSPYHQVTKHRVRTHHAVGHDGHTHYTEKLDPHAIYKHDDGEEHRYYGRGYVQLTHWENYARNGAAVGLSLKLLFKPELALDPATAYKVMSDGMCEGLGFSHSRKLADYLGSRTDYVQARWIVNKLDRCHEIAKIAKHFEAALMTARVFAVAPPDAPVGNSAWQHG